MTKATSSKKFKVQRGDGGGSETFTTIAEVTTFKGPSEKSPQIDASSFDSDGMEYILGLSDGGEVTFDMNFIGDDPQQIGLRTDSRAGTTRNFKIIVPDQGSGSTPTNVVFAALVTAPPDISTGVNQVNKSACTLKVTGVPVWTPRT